MSTQKELANTSIAESYDDPRDIIANRPMTGFQITAVGICVLLNALDGFDVLSISFAAPGIAQEWGIDRAALGVVLSMELIGMAIGSVLLGGLADKLGRRPMILACLVVMGVGMYLASTATGITTLSGYRLFTGLGIGGILAAINAMAAEYSNSKRKSAAVMIMAAGFPLGAVIGGSIASALLVHFDWRAVFIFGSVITFLCIPLVVWTLPESIEFLARKKPENALGQINKTLTRMGHPTVDRLQDRNETIAKLGVRRLLSGNLLRLTLLLTIAYFAHITTFYFILKWIPKIVVDMGNPPSLAGSVLVWANVGGALGSILLGLLTQKFATRALTIVVLAGGSVMVAIFGAGQASLTQLSLVAAAAGFFTNAAVVGIYALMAVSFPTEVRAGGTGFVIGIGRGGAALSPIIAGYLFAAGQSLQTVAFLMAAGSALAIVALLALPKEQPHTVA